MSDEAGGPTVSDNERPHAPVTPSAGVLASGGSAVVYGRTYLRPVPEIVPADLAEVLDPVHDVTGTVVDWRLNPSALVSTRPAQVRAARDTFTRWRARYVTEARLGDLATVRAFLSWAETVSDVSALRALTAPEVRIDPATATRVAAQVKAAAAVCRDRDEGGLGLAAPSRPGLLRGFVTGDRPVVVLAAGTAQVTATRLGLQLTQTGEQAPFPTAVRTTSDTPAQTLSVTGWTVDGDGVTAHTDIGEVDLDDTAAAKLLTHIAPGVAHVRVHAVPLTSIFADLITGLPPLAQTAARNAKPVIIGH